MTPELLARTHAAAFTNARSWSADEFQALTSQDTTILFGDENSFILARRILEEVEILTLATHPTYTRQGRASANLQTLLTDSVSNGVLRVFLEVASDNSPARHLYQQAGFGQIARRERYYTRESGPSVDALILEKRLIAK